MIEARLDMKLLEMCSKCGACFSICPACQYLPGYDPRAVIADILKGEWEKWIPSKSIWQCLECHHCLETCFQHYGFENAMTALRTVAAKRGAHPVQVKRGWDMFVKTSRLGEPALPARKKLDLPPPKDAGAAEFKKLHALIKTAREEKAKRGGGR